MGKGILLVDSSFMPELFHFPKELAEKVTFLGENKYHFKILEFIVESDLIPETSEGQELPVVMPILYSYRPNGDDYLPTEVKLFKLQVSGIFENWVQETRTIYENEEVKGLINSIAIKD